MFHLLLLTIFCSHAKLLLINPFCEVIFLRHCNIHIHSNKESIDHVTIWTGLQRLLNECRRGTSDATSSSALIYHYYHHYCCCYRCCRLFEVFPTSERAIICHSKITGDRRTDRWTEGGMDRRTDRLPDRRTNRRTDMVCKQAEHNCLWIKHEFAWPGGMATKLEPYFFFFLRT